MLAPRVVVCQPSGGSRQAYGVALSMMPMGALAAVWSRLESDNKINLLEGIPRSLLAFRCYALYMYYVDGNLMVA
jgi:hypothetical protein